MSTQQKKKSFIKRAGVASSLICLAAVMSGCSDSEPTMQTHAYKTVDDCISGGVYTENYCRNGYQDALKAHEDKAPRYQSLQDCEEDYGVGQCGTRETTEVHVHNNQSGGSSFMPFFFGYMMGGGFDSNRGTTINNYHSTPVYSNNNGSYKTLSGKSVNQAAFTQAGTKTTASAMKAPTKPVTYTKGQSAKKVAAAKAEKARLQAAQKKAAAAKAAKSKSGMSKSGGGSR